MSTWSCTHEVLSYWGGIPGDYQFKCSRALDCILESTNESGMQMLASAALVLGLTPTMLGYLGRQSRRVGHAIHAVVAAITPPKLCHGFPHL